jgi:DNA polymerase
MRTLFCDIETYSSADLPSVGVYRYAEQEDFDILLFGYAWDNDPVEVIDLTQTLFPEDLKFALYDDRVTKVAHNSAFERTCLSKYLGRQLNPDRWEDTMIMASQCGLPLSLDAVSKALGLSEEESKMKEGKALLRKFCQPRKPTKSNPSTRLRREDDPEQWQIFVEYNRRDVEVERTIYKRLIKWRADPSEFDLWALDQRINDRGIRVDLTLAENAIDIGNDYRERLLDRAQTISGLQNPNSTEQIKQWLREQEGLSVTSLNKKVVADVVASLSDEKCKEFMALRSEFSKSSVKKYEAIERSVCEDGCIHGCFMFCGAGRTGRWAGRLVQLQNLPQNHLEDLDSARRLVLNGDAEGLELIYGDVQDTLSQLIRTALVPEPGQKFIVADFAAIEARVIAWIAGEEWRQKVFAEGGDIYCASASQMFHVPVVKHGVNGELRAKGKIAELALGYGGNINALKAFGADKLGMSDEEMVETVDKWREASPHIVALWRSLEQAAIRCVRRQKPTLSTVGQIRFDFEDGVLWMTLPSLRRIAYWGASFAQNKYGNDELSYMGTDQKTKKWSRLTTWGGKLVENLVQATARDCLKEAMLRLDEAGYDIRGHVHDEVIITCPKETRVEDVSALMGANIPWAPGLLLRADGYECNYYRKD